MALFTNVRDLREAPFLTRFYQAELPAELEAFLRQNEEIELVRAGVPLVEVRRLREQVEPWGLNQVEPELLANLTQWHLALRAVMDALADNGKVPVAHLAALESLAGYTEERRSSYFGVGHRALREMPPGEMVPARDVILWQEDAASAVALQLWQGVFHLFAHPHPAVVRCLECRSPFLLGRRSQDYCSYRCSHRVGSRRRYLRKPANEKYS